jgi:hypothetical protein
MRRIASPARQNRPRSLAAAGIAALTSLMLLGIFLTPASGAVAAGATGANGAVSVRITGVPAAASKLIIEAESPLTMMGAPKRISFDSLVSVPASGGTMMVTVPRSALLDSIGAAQHGWVNLVAVAESATRTYGRMFPVHLSPNTITTAEVRGIGRVSFSRAGSAEPSGIPKRRACVFFQRKSTEGVSRIGELHVAYGGAVEGHYENKYTADVNSSIGASATGGSGSFTADGSAFTGNSISSSGGYETSGAYAWYVNGHLYYGEYQGEGTFCWTNYYITVTSSVGDAFQGTRPAPVNPYKNCHNDPHGLATVNPRGFYGAENSQAHTYDGSFTWFGFGFSVSNGFTHDVRETWDNNSTTTTTYVCGDVKPVQNSGTFWNDNH